MTPRALAAAARQFAHRTTTTRAVVHAYWRFMRERGSTHAAAVTYYALLSMFPLVIFLVSLLGVALRDPTTQTRAINAVVRQAPAGPKLRVELTQAVSDASDDTQSKTGALSVVAALFTLWSASLAFGALRNALNAAFDVPLSRSFLRGHALDVAAMLAVALLAGLSAALTATLGLFQEAAASVAPPLIATPGWALVYGVLSTGVSWAGVLLLYRFVPNHRLRWRDLWLAALLAAVASEIAKLAFGWYVATFGAYQRVYGALGGVIAFLVLIFVIANIVIFAAGFAAELAEERAGEQTASAPPEALPGPAPPQSTTARHE